MAMTLMHVLDGLVRRLMAAVSSEQATSPAQSSPAAKGDNDTPFPALVVTANVGSLFEQVDALLDIWLDAFCAAVDIHNPAFVALHMQEVGGKEYKTSMRFVEVFISRILERESMRRFTCFRAFLDTQFQLEDSFTALGSVFFAEPGLSPQLWNFQTACWESASLQLVTTDSPYQRKEKFASHMYPGTWTRKGYLHTRWQLCGRAYNFVNVHLFHDASNVAAFESTPSLFSEKRMAALKVVLDRCPGDGTELHGFVFGDFNFRLSLKPVVQDIVGLGVLSRSDKGYRAPGKSPHGPDDLVLEPKLFRFRDPEVFLHEHQRFRRFDNEPETKPDLLCELPVAFGPSYAYSEEPDEPSKFLTKRCPGWCDRVMVTKKLHDELSAKGPVWYGLLGVDVCMGDHKPVALSCFL
eukprot:m.22630 g.22630  ORF g.22630 m.22630 type:complete len:409 (+) comp6885_c0_seq2:340-1566(+)